MSLATDFFTFKSIKCHKIFGLKTSASISNYVDQKNTIMDIEFGKHILFQMVKSAALQLRKFH